MKKSIIVVMCVVLSFTGMIVLAKNSDTVTNFFETTKNVKDAAPNFIKPSNQEISAQNTARQNTLMLKEPETIIGSNVPNNQIPDNIFFDMLLNTVKSMDEAAANLEKQGKSGNIWSKYFEREAGLTAQQVALLRQVANDFNREAEPIHRRAMQIINERRASHVTGQKPLAPSPEIALLQIRRDAVALRHRDRLQILLSSEVIERLRRVLEQNNDASQPLTDAERQMFIERARRFRTDGSRTSQNQPQGGSEQ